MKYALVNGQRQVAHPDLKDKGGKCPGCGRPVIARTGEKNIWHWAHKGRRDCDPWWENETEWHRAWKDKFPADWQEFRQKDENGEWHIADVMTDEGWVIEFQRSRLEPDERRARDAFYQPKLVWVVDGTRLKTGIKQFQDALNKGMQVPGIALVRVAFWDKCRLLREWSDTHAPIFFDFNEDMLWWLVSKIPDGPVYVGPLSRTTFIEIHRGGTSQKSDDFEERVMALRRLAADYESYLQAQSLKQPRQDPLRRIDQFYARRGQGSWT